MFETQKIDKNKTYAYGIPLTHYIIYLYTYIDYKHEQLFF